MSQLEHSEAAREAAIQAKIDSWKNGPLALASASPYRIKELDKAGWAHVEPHEVPDAVELKASRQESKKLFTLDEYPLKSTLTQRIAEAKVRHVLASKAIPKNALVCGMDTMPRIFHFNDARVADDVTWRDEFLRKPKTPAEARALTKRVLENLMQNYQTIKAPLVSIDTFARNSKQPANYGMIMALSIEIEVNTGMAVRPPGKETVETTSSSIYLIPTALYEIVDGRSTQTIDGLVEDIIETIAPILARIDMAVEERKVQLMYLEDLAAQFLRELAAWSNKPEK